MVFSRSVFLQTIILVFSFIASGAVAESGRVTSDAARDSRAVILTDHGQDDAAIERAVTLIYSKIADGNITKLLDILERSGFRCNQDDTEEYQYYCIYTAPIFPAIEELYFGNRVLIFQFRRVISLSEKESGDRDKFSVMVSSSVTGL